MTRLLGVWVLAWMGRTAVAAQELDANAFEREVERGREAFGVPGLAVAIVHGEEVVYAKGFGLRSVESGEPVTPETSFGVASNSKAFTAALLGMAMEEGLLSYDDPIVDHLPQFQMWDPWVTREVRIRDFLCHRSGLPVFGGDCLWIGSDLSSAQILARIRHLQPSGPFRAGFQYNNLGWMVSGMVLEKVRGRSWGEELRSRILEPLGMTRTDVSKHDLAQRDNVATPYDQRGGRRVLVEYDDVDSIAAAAALHSTVLDMSRWMALNLQGGEFRGKRLLSKKVVRQMQSLQISTVVSEAQERSRGTRFAGYGLGWGISDYRGYKVVTHSGGLSGMISRQLLVPEIGFGVIVLSNLAPCPLTTPLAYLALDDWLGQAERGPAERMQAAADPANTAMVRKDWVGEAIAADRRRQAARRVAEQGLQDGRPAPRSPLSPLADYCGDYHNAMAGGARVREESGVLVFDYNPRHRGDLEHWQHDTFRVTWREPIFDMPAQCFLRFERDVKGAIQGLDLRFYHPQHFERL